MKIKLCDEVIEYFEETEVEDIEDAVNSLLKTWIQSQHTKEEEKIANGGKTSEMSEL